MLEEIRKGFLTGIGAVILTKEKIEESVQKMVNESKIAEEDARKLVDELAGSGQEQVSKLSADVREVFKNALDNMGVARRDEFEALQKKAAALEARLSILEARPSEGAWRGPEDVQ